MCMIAYALSNGARVERNVSGLHTGCIVPARELCASRAHRLGGPLCVRLRRSGWSNLGAVERARTHIHTHTHLRRRPVKCTKAHQKGACVICVCWPTPQYEGLDGQRADGPHEEQQASELRSVANGAVEDERISANLYESELGRRILANRTAVAAVGAAPAAEPEQKQRQRTEVAKAVEAAAPTRRSERARLVALQARTQRYKQTSAANASNVNLTTPPPPTTNKTTTSASEHRQTKNSQLDGKKDDCFYILPAKFAYYHWPIMEKLSTL